MNSLDFDKLMKSASNNNPLLRTMGNAIGQQIMGTHQESIDINKMSDDEMIKSDAEELFVSNSKEASDNPEIRRLDKLSKDKKTAVSIDQDIYMPFHVAIDLTLNDALDNRPIIELSVLMFYSLWFIGHAKVAKQYEKLVERLQAQVTLKKLDRPFGHHTPLEMIPNTNVVFKALVKTKLIDKPKMVGALELYSLTSFPIHVKKDWLYPALKHCLGDWWDIIIGEKHTVYITKDFQIALPRALATRMGHEINENLIDNPETDKVIEIETFEYKGSRVLNGYEDKIMVTFY